MQTNSNSKNTMPMNILLHRKEIINQNSGNCGCYHASFTKSYVRCSHGLSNRDYCEHSRILILLLYEKVVPAVVARDHCPQEISTPPSTRTFSRYLSC
jgi:hypothetical protein